MAEQTQEKSLEQRLLEIGSLSQLNKGINKAKYPSERYQLYQNLAGILSEGDPNLYKTAYGDIRISPEEAVRYALEGTHSRVKEAEPLYQANKEKITKEVISAIKEDVKNAKNKAEAAALLSFYLKGLHDIPDLDQITADEYAQEEAAEKLGVNMNFSARGSIEKYRPLHENLQARLYASEYLKDIKDKKGEAIGYELDEEKITKLMDKVETGALMYKNSKDLAKLKEAIKEAEKKQKKIKKAA